MIWFKDYTLDFLEDVRSANMAKHIGLELIEVGPDFLRGRMPVDERTTQPFGILHGGASCVLSGCISRRTQDRDTQNPGATSPRQQWRIPGFSKNSPQSFDPPQSGSAQILSPPLSAIASANCSGRS